MGIAAVLTAMAAVKARMPYNEQGRYFDGLVVHQSGAEYVYGALALVFWAVGLGLGRWAHRRIKRTRPGAPGNEPQDN